MASASGRFAITFNGEIYNYQELRDELRGRGFRPKTDTDTEVMLAAFDTWGICESVARFNGMFAFAVFDRKAKRLVLCRDRMGEKPLYYGWLGSCFVFASELKAIKAHPGFSGVLNHTALYHFLSRSYVPAPISIYAGVFKLPPGTTLTLSSWDARDSKAVPYWSLEETANSAYSRESALSESETVQQLDFLLRNAVGIRMHADVPLGVFLSGGVDSSAIAAIMQSQSNRPVRTFTVGFGESSYNEASHAKAVASHLGCEHTDLVATPKDALDLIPRLHEAYDEPFADPSQIPTMLLAQMTRRHVVVSLSGDGGDEIFGGYRRYSFLPRIWNLVGGVPSPIRRAAAELLLTPPSWAWDCVSGALDRILTPGAHRNSLEQRIARLSELIALPGPNDMYERMISTWPEPNRLLTEKVQGLRSLPPQRMVDFASRMMFWDAATYLPDDILVKVDRASMSTGLESRAPFLDHRVVEFAWRLPLEKLIRDNKGKWILRQVLDRYVPRTLIERPKMGFDVPIGSWLRGPLRSWAEELLAESRIVSEGFLRPDPIREKWEEHISGKRNWESHLWNVLVFQDWLENE